MFLKTFSKLSLVFLLLVFSARPSFASADPLLGFWMTEGKDGVVEFFVCEDKQICGRFYWLKEDSADQPSLDDKNPDPKMRKRPLCGLTFLGGFSNEGRGVYEGGWIYSPRHGSVFGADIHVADDKTLLLRGYLFISLFGGTQTWTRAENPVACHLLSAGV